MLTEVYIEILLVDEDLADQVWDVGMIPDDLAVWAWGILASAVQTSQRVDASQGGARNG